jgi:hypothetical protein
VATCNFSFSDYCLMTLRRIYYVTITHIKCLCACLAKYEQYKDETINSEKHKKQVRTIGHSAKNWKYICKMITQERLIVLTCLPQEGLLDLGP